MMEDELDHRYHPGLYALFQESIRTELRPRAKTDIALFIITAAFFVLSQFHRLWLYLGGVACFFLITYGWKTLYYWYALKRPQQAWRMMTSSMLEVSPQEYLDSIEDELRSPRVDTSNAIVTENWLLVKKMLPAGGITLLLDIELLWIEMYHDGRELRLQTNSGRTLIVHGTDEEIATIIAQLQTRNPEIRVKQDVHWLEEHLGNN